ncbi:MAG TPA: hypothetical protein VIB08_10100, partial [Thermoanaerobaculia bacterium]
GQDSRWWLSRPRRSWRGVSARHPWNPGQRLAERDRGLQSVRETSGGAEADVRDRRTGAVETIRVSRIVNCTAPTAMRAASRIRCSRLCGPGERSCCG